MLFNFLILCVTQHLKETRDFVIPKMNVPTWVDELLEFAPKDLESAACVMKNIYTFRAQSFTSLKAGLRQDINRGFVFSGCLNGTFS